MASNNGVSVRDHLKDGTHFEKITEFYQTAFAEFMAELSGRQGEGYLTTADIAWLWGFYSLYASYSRGDPIVTMRQHVKTLANLFCQNRKALQKAEREASVSQETIAMYSRLDLDTMDQFFALLAFMVALRFEPAEIVRVLDVSGFSPQDVLLGKIAKLLGCQVAQPSDGLKFPKCYKNLLAVVNAPANDQPAALLRHMQNWEKGIKKIAWHGSQPGDSYSGYWAFEAALVAMLYKIDDSAVQGLPYYPADLVRHYRASAPIGN